MGFTDVHDTRLLGGPRMAGATQTYGGNKIQWSKLIRNIFLIEYEKGTKN